MSCTQIHDRLRAVLKDHSCRGLAQALSMRPETVRRYIRGAEPSAQFLCRLTTRLGLNVNWLLSGKGPVFLDAEEERPQRTDRSGEAARALAKAIDDFEERLRRLEHAASSGRSTVDAGVHSELERRIAKYDGSESLEQPEKIVMRLAGSTQINSISA